jgi:oligoribonuclease (3'-5' exoribonuclease)
MNKSGVSEMTDEILFLTIEELAARWKVHPQVLQQLRSKKQPPLHIKLGNDIRYSISEVIMFEANDISRFN